MIDAIRGQPATQANAAGEAERLEPDRTPTGSTRSGAGADDAELVARAKQDRQAFAVLYDRYLGPIYRFCYARLGGKEAAEDATALVFTKALDALPACRDGHFRPWLFAIARNVVADVYRHAHPAEPLDAAARLPDPAPSPDDLALRADDGRTMRALIARLSPEQRDVVELRLAGLTGPEIARALGRSHAAVRVAQFRAYARLRAFLQADQTDARVQPEERRKEPPR